ncbi:helix-turn-helix domain-containing protein [Acetobacter fallax]|uniref:Helix-turn-helix domain-containing protein n=1 Tax=Acetobacter fallax TaxID=1737473 RepID=A0ABX0KD73_9PROT|nr:helix-turn-helix transcriptional regulator [Acetobacter fallax]NHO32833.1 helix-turn-helix domain-containing protein [Acetobacter fallax]NHO36383.1 helix-turn-helix domain-containing protein [Acetobacter fallax]
MYAKSFCFLSEDVASSRSTLWLFGSPVRQTDRRTTDPHVHERGQIFVVESGVMAVITQSSYWLIVPGQLLWLPPGFVHEARSHGAIAGWSLYITAERCSSVAHDPFVSDCTRLLLAQVERLSKNAKEAACQASFTRLSESFWDEFLSIPRHSVSLPFPEDARLKRVTEALSAIPADPRSQQEWADMAGMSLRSFIRHFTAEMGMPFSVWRQRLRILNAQERLARRERVTDVAAAVGYESLGAFTAAFRKATGCSPSAHAQRCRNGATYQM